MFAVNALEKRKRQAHGMNLAEIKQLEKAIEKLNGLEREKQV